MSHVTRAFLYICVFILIVFVYGYLIKLSWNYTVPRVLYSLTKSDESFTPLGFWPAISLSILIGLLFGGITSSGSSILLLDYVDAI